jgi:hypothetical protein
MQTTRFQLGLLATMAVALGLSLSSLPATGYPAGATVSLGSNPLWSEGGTIGSGTTDLPIVTAPADQALVVTDLLVSGECNSCNVQVVLKAGSRTIGSVRLYSYATGGNYSSSPRWIGHSFSSGLVVPAGETLTMSTTEYRIDYTLSGYYAQP